MPRELTNLLHLRTVAKQNFRVAFRANDWDAIETFRKEVDALQRKIDQATTELLK